MNLATIKTFMEDYYNIDNLLDKLRAIYSFAKHHEDKETYLKALKDLILEFSNDSFHLSEIKTVLVITMPFSKVSYLSNERKTLVNIYVNKKNNT